MIATWVPLFWRWLKDDLWPVLYPALIDIGASIVETLGKVGVSLWETTRDVWVPALWKWVIDDAWPKLRDAVADLRRLVFGTLDEWSKAFWDTMSKAGDSIVSGLRDGVQRSWNNLTSWLNGLWNSIPLGFKNVMRIASPSRVMWDLAVDTMDGLAGGLNEGYSAVASAFEGVIGGIMGKVGDMESALNKPITIGPSIKIQPVTQMPPDLQVLPDVPHDFVESGPFVDTKTIPAFVKAAFGGDLPDFAKLPKAISDMFDNALTAAQVIASGAPMQGHYKDQYGEGGWIWQNIQRAIRDFERGSEVNQLDIIKKPTQPIRHDLIAMNSNYAQLMTAIFGQNQTHRTVFQDAFAELAPAIQKLAQKAIETFGYEGLGWDPGAGLSSSIGQNHTGVAAPNQFNAIMSLAELGNMNFAQLGGTQNQSAGNVMLDALKGLIDKMVNEGVIAKPTNNITINVPPGSSDTSQIAYMVEYLNAVLTN